MKKIFTLMAVAAMLAACADDASDDTVDPTPDPDPDPTTPVEAVELTRGDLDSGTVGAGSLVVQITLDGGADVDQVYDNLVDTNGVYSIYELDEGSTGRLFTAIGGESDDGQLSAVVVSDGGQFNRFFGGATVNQVSFVAPDGGTTDYVGDYQGLLNFGDEAQNGVSGSDSATAVRSFIVDGEVFLKADFTDGVVNGAIFNRTYDDGAEDLPEIVLIVGDITEDGTFSGSVELTDLTGVGQYSGAFGGEGATSAAGLIDLDAGFLGTTDLLDEENNPIPDPENPGEFLQESLGDGNENEYGIFILSED